MTIETRSPVPELQPEPKAKEAASDEAGTRCKVGPQRSSRTVDEVAQQVVDLTLSDDEEPVKRGRAPRKPRKTPKVKAKEVKPVDPAPQPEPEPADDSLTRLLAQCTLPSPVPFSDIFTHSAFSKLVSGSELKKQGEASYSEVFRVGDAVVKVIPLLGGSEPEGEEDVPDCSGAEDVAREIEVTRRMARVPGGGFVGFRG